MSHMIQSGVNRPFNLKIGDNDTNKVPVSAGDPVAIDIATLKGDEGVSTLFKFEIEFECSSADVLLGDLLVKKTVLSFNRQDGTNLNIYGMITVADYVKDSGSVHVYRLVLEPRIRALLESKNTRRFQLLPVADKSGNDGIINKIITTLPDPSASDSPFTTDDFRISLKADLKNKDNRVQYNETDFEFMSRLLQEDTLWFYIEHNDTSKKDVIVITDSEIPELGNADQESQSEPNKKDAISYQASSGDIFEFLSTNKAPKSPWAEVDYPYTSTKSDVLYTGTAHFVGLKSGYKFKLKDHPKKEFNLDEATDGYLVTFIHHELNSSKKDGSWLASYIASFKGVRAAQYAPPFVKVRVHFGSDTEYLLEQVNRINHNIGFDNDVANPLILNNQDTVYQIRSHLGHTIQMDDNTGGGNTGITIRTATDDEVESHGGTVVNGPSKKDYLIGAQKDMSRYWQSAINLGGYRFMPPAVRVVNSAKFIMGWVTAAFAMNAPAMIGLIAEAIATASATSWKSSVGTMTDQGAGDSGYGGENLGSTEPNGVKIQSDKSIDLFGLCGVNIVSPSLLGQTFQWMGGAYDAKEASSAWAGVNGIMNIVWKGVVKKAVRNISKLFKGKNILSEYKKSVLAQYKSPSLTPGAKIIKRANEIGEYNGGIRWRRILANSINELMNFAGIGLKAAGQINLNSFQNITLSSGYDGVDIVSAGEINQQADLNIALGSDQGISIKARGIYKKFSDREPLATGGDLIGAIYKRAKGQEMPTLMKDVLMPITIHNEYSDVIMRGGRGVFLYAHGREKWTDWSKNGPDEEDGTYDSKFDLPDDPNGNLLMQADKGKIVIRTYGEGSNSLGIDNLKASSDNDYEGGHIFISTRAEKAGINLQTLGQKSSILIKTVGEEDANAGAPIYLQTLGGKSPITLETKNSKGPILVKTNKANSEITLESHDASSPIRIATNKGDSKIEIDSSASDVTIQASTKSKITLGKTGKVEVKGTKEVNIKSYSNLVLEAAKGKISIRMRETKVLQDKTIVTLSTQQMKMLKLESSIAKINAQLTKVGGSLLMLG